MKIKKYSESLNEEFDFTQILLQVGAMYFFYKFWKAFFAKYAAERTLKASSKSLLGAIKSLMDDVKSGRDKNAIAINDFNDRIFIRVKGFDKDIRIFKETKTVQMGNDVKIPLSDNDYAELIKIIGTL